MRRILPVLMLIPAMLLAALVTGGASAQTPDASPVAGGWQVTDARETALDGEPVVLSPDGTWLAGTDAERTAVCVWDVETLTPTCVEVGVEVWSAPGGMTMRWAPDSSAFAFVSGDLARLNYGDVMVFDMETREIVNLTGIEGSTDSPMYIGADWTVDSTQVIFAAYHALVDQTEPDALFRVDRDGGEPMEIPLPAWSEPYSIYYPPLIADDAVLVSVDARGEAGGVWRVGLDGSDPVKLVSASGTDAVPDPLVISVSPDGRYANVVSVFRMNQFEPEGTYFILDIASGDLVELVFDEGLGLVTFAPDGDTGLTVLDDRLATVDPVTGATQPVANSPETFVWFVEIPVWAANDTVFLPGDGGMLVTLAPGA